MNSVKVFIAEFIGTFALVLVGAAAGLYNVGVLGVALAHGLTLAVFAYVYGYVSGTHINPAVTLGLALNGDVKWSDTPIYWLAQFFGAAAAAFSLRTFVNVINPTAFDGVATKGLLTIDHPFYALTVEALLTFFLVNTILHVTAKGKSGPFTGWVIGTTLTIAILAGGPLTGAALNPARAIGPALFTKAIDATKLDALNPSFYLVYFMGPIIGSTLAVLLYQVFKSESDVSISVDDDMDIDEEDAEEIEEVEEVVEEAMKKIARKSATARKSKK